MRLRDRLIKGTALNTIAVSFNQGSTLIISIIVARLLMKQSFGEFSMVQGTLITGAALSQLATGYTASKYIAEYRSTNPEKAGRIMGLCAIVSGLVAGGAVLVLFVMAPWLAKTMLNAPHLATGLRIGSGFLFFSAINGYQTGALSGLEAYGGLAKAGVFSGIITVAAVSLGAWRGGLNGALIGLSMSAFIRCAFHYGWLRIESRFQSIRPRYRDSLGKEKAILFNFALPAALSSYYTLPMIWLANSVLVRQPGGYGEMALYSAANNLRILVLFLPNIMNNVGLSILNYEKAKGDPKLFHQLFKSNMASMFLVTLGGAAFVGIFGSLILRLFGRDFAAGRILLRILLASCLFEGLSIGLYQYIQSHARIWLSFFGINVPREAFLVIMAYVLIPSLGGAGLALAYLGSMIVGLILHSSIVFRIYQKNGGSRFSLTMRKRSVGAKP
jgi:O-antigen/teichoic acid export membrane protein